MKLLTSLVLLFLSFSVSAQSTFISTSTHLHFPTDFVKTTDNGFLIGGQMHDSSSGGLIDMCAVIKLDSLGNEQWVHMYSDAGHDSWITSVLQTSDGKYIFCGRPDGMISHNAFMIKASSTGSLIWSRKFNLPNFISEAEIYCIESHDGNYMVAVNQHSAYNVLSLIKLDMNGNLIWERNYSDSTGIHGRCYTLTENSDHGFALAGGYESNCFILRTDSIGIPLWYNEYNDSLYQSRPGISIKQTLDNGFLVACSDQLYGGAVLIRTDSSGTISWVKNFQSPGGHRLGSLYETSDGHYLLPGSVGDPNSQTQKMSLIKIDQLGDTIWTKTYNSGPDHFAGIKAVEIFDGSLTILCQSDDVHACLYKTDSYGNLSCNQDTSTTTISQIQLQTTNRILTVDSLSNPGSIVIFNQAYPDNTNISCYSASTDIVLPGQNLISTYPIPATDKLKINCSLPILQVEIYSVVGNLRKTEINKSEIEVAGLLPGIYFARIKSTVGSSTVKFIKK